MPPGVFELHVNPPTPIVAGAPCYTEDGRVWDGAVLYRRIADRWGGSEAKLLRAVDVMVRRTIAEAGFVRFADGWWRLEAWESEQGRTLSLLGGEVLRPRLR